MATSDSAPNTKDETQDCSETNVENEVVKEALQDLEDLNKDFMQLEVWHFIVLPYKSRILKWINFG